MSNEKLPEYVQALLEPSIYPHPVEKVELIQTHISFVTLAGEYVYKWKKPVDFGFLDFSTIDKRRGFCEQELSLNRRLCPELYLEVVTICKDDTGMVFNGQGTVVEYGVKMNRMDESGLMSRKIAQSSLTKMDLDGVVASLVPFYESAAGDETIQNFATAEGFGVNVKENFDQTEVFIGKGGLTQELFDQVKQYSLNFLNDENVFQERIAQGRVRDCHGDLYSANICFDQGKTQIFDCIEFNERFRYSDVAADIGFLAMDLDFHDLDELAEYFVKAYVKKSGDEGIWKVLNFYKCYRAYVRAKIGLFTATDPAVDESFSKKCLEDTARYFELAKRYASAG